MQARQSRSGRRSEPAPPAPTKRADMIDYNTERVLVTIETVQEIVPIDGADRIESARIRNWWVVVTKDMHNVGDSVLYFEIDSALPLADPRFESYRKFGVKTLPDGTEVHRLKTANMRGSFSQGTVLPSAIFANEIATVDPSDPLALQRAIGVGLWESDIDDPTLFCGDFPTHLARKSGSIRAENLTPRQWGVIADLDWIATEKVDGTSCTLIRDQDGELVLASRKMQARLDTDNRYSRAVTDVGLDAALLAEADVDTIQMEIAGPTTGHKNTLDLKGPRVFIFAVFKGREAVPRADWPQWALNLAAPVLEVNFPETVPELVAMADGLESVVTPGRRAEGMVWSLAGGAAEQRLLPAELEHPTIKVISRKLLARNKD